MAVGAAVLAFIGAYAPPPIEGEGSVAVPEAMELVYAEIRDPYYRRSFTLSRELDASKIEAPRSAAAAAS